MVDFPEGYGFKPGTKAHPMQETFTVVLGTFSRRDHWRRTGRNTAPYEFTEIAVIRKEFTELAAVRKEAQEAVIRGILLGPGEGPPIEGTLQQVVTALCTLHRMKGGMK